MSILSKFLILILFCGCANKWDIQSNKFKESSFLLECDGSSYVLKTNGINFSLFDSMFVPIVSRSLENNKFKNDKFLPPNSKFDPIFVGIINMMQKDFKFSTIKSKNLVCEVNEI